MTRLIKKIGKHLLCGILEWQVGRLRLKNSFVIVVVAGSVGKTSTKLAIAQLLQASRKVIFQNGNYNDRLTVPLVLFGRNEPSIFDIPGWLRLLLANERTLRRAYPYEIAVLELGPDGPGQMKKFAYLCPELGVLTAISEEHMEFFKTLDAVAEEELTLLSFAQKSLVNIDDIPERYRIGAQAQTYGLDPAANWRVTKREDIGLNGQKLIISGSAASITIQIPFFGKQGAKIVLAAVAAASLIGLTPEEIQRGAAKFRPVAGRMQALAGKRQSRLLDDTYNASPVAVKAALDVLYETAAPQKIAILGSMNEMGEMSERLHREIGAYCDPAKLDLVVTIGEAANGWLADTAEQKGCKVSRFTNPRLAGEWVLARLQPGSLILAKGSQNGVFTEEALVPLLEDPQDIVKLVRQSIAWQARKKSLLAVNR